MRLRPELTLTHPQTHEPRGKNWGGQGRWVPARIFPAPTPQANRLKYGGEHGTKRKPRSPLQGHGSRGYLPYGPLVSVWRSPRRAAPAPAGRGGGELCLPGLLRSAARRRRPQAASVSSRASTDPDTQRLPKRLDMQRPPLPWLGYGGRPTDERGGRRPRWRPTRPSSTCSAMPWHTGIPGSVGLRADWGGN